MILSTIQSLIGGQQDLFDRGGPDLANIYLVGMIINALTMEYPDNGTKLIMPQKLDMKIIQLQILNRRHLKFGQEHAHSGKNNKFCQKKAIT